MDLGPAPMRKLLAIAIAIMVAVILLISRRSGEIVPSHAESLVPSSNSTSADSDPRLAESIVEESSRTPAAQLPASGAADQKSRLIVLVVSKKDRAPVARARVGVYKPGDPSRHLLADIEGSVGDFDHRPVTGADGRVELVLDPGIEYLVRALGDPIQDGSASADVASMHPGETRTLTIEIPSLVDSRVFGQVVAYEGGAPVEGAQVLVSYDSTRDVRTDSDGRFDVELTLRRQPYLKIEAKGFGPAFVVPGAGYGSAEAPMIVRLVRSATLVAKLVDRAGKPIGAGSVRLSASGHALSGDEKNFRNEFVSLPDQEWSKNVDSEGTCRFDDLPADVSLNVDISVPHREAKHDATPLSLRPGQVLEREWNVGAGCRLTGKVVDSEGIPAAGVAIWLAADDASHRRLFDRFSIVTKHRGTTSAKDGAFEFPDVDPGSWLVGPGPDEAKNSIAPFPDVVAVPDGAAEIVHDLRIVRGLFVRGRVLDSQGSPAAGAFIYGWMKEPPWSTQARSRKDGTFEFGPLVPGRYELEASTPMKEEANSDPVTATAGDQDVVLRLRVGGSLSGKVVDSITGSPCSAELVLSDRSDENGYLSLPRSGEDGSFRCKGLPPGTYDVAARTPDGRFGRQLGIVVRAETESDSAVVAVGPGAKLHVRYEAVSGYGQVEVRGDGCIVAADGIAAGSTKVWVVPAGRVVAELRSPKQSQAVDLAVGEEKTVVLTGPK